MNDYSLALFLHVVGALGLFVALGLEWTGLQQIGRAMPSELVGAWMGVLGNARRVGFASMLTAVLSGIYMTVREWGGAAWVLVSVAGLILVIVLSTAVTQPRMVAIVRAVPGEKGVTSRAFRGLANHPLLWISVQTRIAIVLGIVLLKIAKPGFGGSLLTIGTAIVFGVASAVPRLSRQRRDEALPVE